MTEYQLETDYDAYYPGTDALVTLSWSNLEAPQSVTVRLVWRTEGKGTQDQAVVRSQAFTPETMAGNTQLKFRLPWGPYSFSGKLISVVWAFELVSGRNAKAARKEFVLGHNAQETLIGPAKETAL